jgi:hypothetical protein
MHAWNRCPLASLLIASILGTSGCTYAGDHSGVIVGPATVQDSIRIVVPIGPSPATPVVPLDTIDPEEAVPVEPRVDSIPKLAWSDFDDGTVAPYSEPWGNSAEVIEDPTGAGHGKIARIRYSPAAGSSHELGLAYTSPAALRYGKTIWMKGDLYLPSNFANRRASDNRKLIDYQGGGVRLTLHREGPTDVRVSVVEWMSGTQTEPIAESTGIVLPDDQWVTLEVRMTTNSADNVRDGVLEVYVNGAATPSYRRATGLGWITEKFVGPYGAGSYFNTFLLGFQLTNGGTVAYSEDRYWDNVGFSETRLR